jgi:hypothetical protein
MVAFEGMGKGIDDEYQCGRSVVEDKEEAIWRNSAGDGDDCGGEFNYDGGKY